MSPLSLAQPVTDHDWRWVTAAPFRAYLRQLLNETGLPWRVLAGEVGIPDRIVGGLLRGRGGRPLRRIPPHYARRLLGVDAETLCDGLRELVPAMASHAAAHRLFGSGWSAARIAAAAGSTAAETEALLLGRTSRVPRRMQAMLEGAARAHALHQYDPDPQDGPTSPLADDVRCAAA